MSAQPVPEDLSSRSPPRGTFDERVVLHGVSWEQYEAVLAMRGDGAGPRISYLRGELELMSPSRDHERIKKCLARLVEAYAEETGLRLDGFGALTMRERPKARGLEPDECYELDGPKERPDFAIEVVWTHGGIDKLEIYRGLGVREVWFWEDERIEVHALRGDDYVTIRRSEVLPALDLDIIARLATRADQTSAVRELRKTLRG